MTIRYFIHLLARFLSLTGTQQIELYYFLTRTKTDRDDNSSPTNKGDTDELRSTNIGSDEEEARAAKSG